MPGPWSEALVSRYSLGLDFGTESAHTVLVDVATRPSGVAAHPKHRLAYDTLYGEYRKL
jgi:hypothetical protein